VCPRFPSSREVFLCEFDAVAPFSSKWNLTVSS